MQVFKKFGVEKFDPLNEKFDPNKHAALFQIPDPSKPSGTVAAVVKVCSSDNFGIGFLPPFSSEIRAHSSPVLNLNVCWFKVAYLYITFYYSYVDQIT